MVTSVSYRHPGVLVKTVSTLDVLSGGRMYLGIGAGAPWNVQPSGPGTAWEAEGLGIPFASLKDRFEKLEETLQIAHRMWSGDETPFDGRRYQLVRPLNSPQPVQHPNPPIEKTVGVRPDLTDPEKGSPRCSPGWRSWPDLVSVTRS